MRDLDELAAYIGMESERASDLVEGRIHKEAKLISKFPYSGRIGRAPGTRERVVGRTPHILVIGSSQDGFAFSGSITAPGSGPNIFNFPLRRVSHL